jgi:small subunit ribosomal protein S2
METDVLNEKNGASEQEGDEKALPVVELSAEDKAKLPILEEMMKAGMMYGRKKSVTNPKMKGYVYTFRNGIAIFDLVRTLENLAKAEEFLKGVMAKGGKILVVGTQPAARDLVKSFAEELGQFYVNERWLGGMLTNFKTVNSRVERFKMLKADKAAGRLAKYTKKEQLLLEREIENFAIVFSGVEQMTTLPAAVLIIDPVIHETALREARRMKLPVVALVSSDGNPDDMAYPIPVNSSARPSIVWVLEKLKSALKNVKVETMAGAAAVASVK